MKLNFTHHAPRTTHPLKSVAFFILLMALSLPLSTRAQPGATIEACGPSCIFTCPVGINQSFVYIGTTGSGASLRYRYGNPQGLPWFIEFNTTLNRWEIFSSDGIELTLFYYSTVASIPNPPNLTLGNWVKVDCTNDLLVFGGTGTQSALVLPIELVSFDAQTIEGSKNHLTWRTASEKDNSHFDIERSTDGTTFHSIGQVKGNNKPSRYQFVDNQPFATSYYRLRQIDFDGTETVSKVVSVVLKGKGKGLTIYPTLVSNGILSVDTEGADYNIYNIVGQQVQRGKTTQRLDVSALAKGTYILKVGTEQAKFVKQ